VSFAKTSEIIKILSKDPEIVILDEATSALAENRVKWLLCLARKLANKGKIVIFISHRMSEITDCCDNITILRNGVVSGNLPINKDLDLDEVVSLMLGRKLENYYPKIECHTQQSQLLELHDVHYRSLLNHIDFVLHHGEVLGLGGLAGQGQAELLLGLYGICRLEGQVRLNRKAISINSPKEAISHQIALIPEERGIQGLFLRLGIDFNISIPSVDSLSKFGVVDELKEEQLVDRYMKALSIKAQGRKSAVQELSGGNQQKVVMAKIMSCNPELYLMHDITRGVDVGTKREMFNIVRKLALEGCGILYFSTDVDELVHVCDRVLVMQDGYVRANLEGNEITKENIIGASIGVYKSGAKNE
jgi:ABC-type sugar transport system ATPase subunit